MEGHADPPRHRPPRLRRVLRLGRAAAPAGAGRQAGRRRRHRATRGRDDGLLRGAQVRHRFRLAGRARAPAVPAGDLHPARLRRLRREVARGLVAGARAPPDRVAGGHGRGLRRRDGVREAAAGAARARRGGPRPHRHHDVGRRRAEPADRKGVIGPKTAERLAAIGLTTIGALQRADEQALASRFGERYARDLVSRAHFHGSDVVEAESGPAKSRSNETTFDRDIADLAELEVVLTRLAGQLCESLQRKRARGRTIAIKVRLDDWTTVTRARTLPGAVNDTATITAVALELLRAYAPPRAVRLLGVRVAAFDELDAELPAAGPQLAL